MPTTALDAHAGPRPTTAEQAADAAAVTSLLNCYLRETGSVATGTVRLERLGLELTAPVRYRRYLADLAEERLGVGERPHSATFGTVRNALDEVAAP
jgi:siderophore synthetase component